ncbi:MAG: hypothetical protein ACK5VT_06350 [Alphaproteobacteria bacterium]|jgi:hypothetical protein
MAPVSSLRNFGSAIAVVSFSNVIPAQAGIQTNRKWGADAPRWMSACAGMTI